MCSSDLKSGAGNSAPLFASGTSTDGLTEMLDGLPDGMVGDLIVGLTAAGEVVPLVSSELGRVTHQH